LFNPRIEIQDITITPPNGSVFGILEGKVHNYGRGNARYVEVGVKFIDENGVVLTTGYTNMSNVGPGEKRVFSMIISNYPTVPSTYEAYYSLSVGGAMF